MSVEAEMSVLGAAVLDRRYAQEASDALAPEMFTHGHTQRIFQTISDLYWAGKNIDMTILLEKIPEEKVTLVKLAQYVPTLSHFGDYIKIVQDEWQARSLQESLLAVSYTHLTLPTILRV